MFVRVGGVPHHVVVEGSGPPCVLSAGLGLAWFDWDPVVPLLTPYRTVVRFDRPGHGLSGPAAVAPTAAGEAHRIAALLDALGLRRATVVGHSIAGFHAEAFARLHPCRTSAVVLVDSSVEEDATVPAAPGIRTAVATALGATLGAAGVPVALGPLARRLGVRLSRASGGGDPAPASLVHRCYTTSRVLRGTLLENAHYRAVAAELLALRRRRPLPAVPVAVLAGTAGGRRWTARQRGLALELGARFEEVTPAGHLVMLDRPDAVARAILEDSARPSRAA
ncbi:alpha/beta fold hydrolase [Streptomyces sp. NPDC057638]|uniref:alpha/beta fold hydrolase n=1 Tax=Streptomyces sp. NPDC057638 TaxID=3346190 RepID=UPI0036B3A9A1